MIITKHKVIEGSSPRPIALDIRYDEDQEQKGVFIFCHGFKGFKDWGHWSLVADTFARQGYAFLKYNLSHNGVSLDAPTEFADLEAFGDNRFSIEVSDTHAVLDWLHSTESLDDSLQALPCHLIGHSRGGPIVIAAAHQDHRVSSCVCWASVHRLDYAWGAPGILDQWRKDGIYHVINGRTQQKMPLKYSLYEDYVENESMLDTKINLQAMSKPTLFIHGTRDLAIHHRASELLAEWSRDGELVLIKDANHVFGAQHPWTQDILPAHSQQMVDECIRFVNAKF